MLKLIETFFLTLLYLLVFTCIDLMFHIPHADSSISMAQNLTFTGNWEEFINFSTNAFFLWRLDPLNKFICGLFGYNIANINYITALSIFSGGLFYFVKNHFNKTLVAAFTYSFAFTLTVEYLFGYNTPLLFGICWLPLVLIFSVSRIENMSAAKVTLYSLLIAALINQSANQLSPFIILISLLIFFLKNDQYKEKRIVYIYAAFIITTVVFQVLVPAINFPDYPHFAALVKDDGLPGYIMPLVGAFDTPPSIDRLALKGLLHRTSLIMLFYGFLVFLIARLNLRRDAKILANTGLCLAMFVFLDIYTAESISQISPLASLTRVIPGLFHFTLAETTLVTGFLFLYLSALQNKRSLIALSFSIFVLLVPLQRGFSKFEIGQNLTHEAENAVRTLNEERASLKIGSEQYQYNVERLISPSYSLINKFGTWIVGKNILQQEEKVIGIPPIITASSHDRENLSTVLFDNKNHNRWSPKTGSQQGNEWLQLDFQNLETLSGLEIESGEFATDFPRCIRISGGTDCQSLKTVQEISPWLGSVLYTPHGYPYYGPQNNVRIIFENPVSLKCLRIEQICKTGNYDWSVTELKFLKDKNN